eukprot:1195733-Prorocentrum_minimum.AAC.12
MLRWGFCRVVDFAAECFFRYLCTRSFVFFGGILYPSRAPGPVLTACSPSSSPPTTPGPSRPLPSRPRMLHPKVNTRPPSVTATVWHRPEHPPDPPSLRETALQGPRSGNYDHLVRCKPR